MRLKFSGQNVLWWIAFRLTNYLFLLLYFQFRIQYEQCNRQYFPQVSYLLLSELLIRKRLFVGHDDARPLQVKWKIHELDGEMGVAGWLLNSDKFTFQIRRPS